MEAWRHGGVGKYSVISGFSSYIIMKIVEDEMVGIKVRCFGEKSKGNSVSSQYSAVSSRQFAVRRKKSA